MTHNAFCVIFKTYLSLKYRLAVPAGEIMDIKDIRTEYKNGKKKLKDEYRQGKRQLKDKLKRDINTCCPPAVSGKQPMRLSVLEEIGNAVTHGVGSLLSIAGFVLMLTGSGSAAETVSACVYFFGLFILFTMSCLYHSFKYGSTVKRVFRRFDHASIYLLIGATFAPILLAYIGGVRGLVFFIVQWAVIALGVTLIGVFGPTKFKRLNFSLYLILGWSALLFMPYIIKHDPGFSVWILGGGIVYTLGTIPFRIKRKVSHFIWHFFVLAGAIIQWFGIYFYIYNR